MPDDKTYSIACMVLLTNTILQTSFVITFFIKSMFAFIVLFICCCKYMTVSVYLFSDHDCCCRRTGLLSLSLLWTTGR